jgi:sensor histidine kinase YesM
VGISGCVFDEENSQNLTYNPFDAFMLNKLYANDFEEQFKNYFVGHYSYRNYLIQMYHNELNLGFFLLGLILATIFLLVLIIKNVFKNHQWNWFAYIKQGLFLISIAVVFTICLCLKDLKLDTSDFFMILNLVVSGFIAVNLIYIIEKTILTNRSLGGLKIIIYFSATLVVLVIVSFPLSFRSSAQDIIFNFPLRYNLLLPYIIVISLGRSLYIFLNDRYNSIIHEKEVELAQMGELQKQAELDSLRAKINPHFLYNALNSIASLAITDAHKTEQMALALSDFFKYAINREQKQLNSLSEELSATRTYLEIEKVQFGNRLNFEINCNPELQDIQIPQLLIQPLVENAIKHGLSQITGIGIIRIVIAKESNQLNIRVYDNGPSFPDGPLSGFGIQNTQQRITLLYGSKATINWNNRPEKFIELSLPLGY